MQLPMSVFVVVLFIALTPGVLVTLPKKGSKFVILTHGLIFALIYHFTYKVALNYFYEGFAGRVRPKPKPKAKVSRAAAPSYASAIATVQALMAKTLSDADVLQQAKLNANKMAAVNKPASLQLAVASGGKHCVSYRDCNMAPCNTPDGGAPDQSNPGICRWNWMTNSH
jgi:hypothetical protein